MMIQKTEHFFKDAVDLENPDTGEMVTLSMSLYDSLSKSMADVSIFDYVIKTYAL